ncbi:M48 family metallopeptidase [Calycomorphotria hydatis]|uniref:Peptidase family M48 n=1 Tax=Calycomorphotria hydatis TaxID=2528027 RepID=A0A517TE16_9PLAN|nr:M48 family metallopeptidase [Calycomorphotria hydatis]QDT66620.1 Peptidase family M48 [Calycomorphotria hydatis]
MKRLLCFSIAMASCLVDVSLANAGDEAPPQELVKPAFVTRFDFADRNELYYSQFIRDLATGDSLSDWPLFDLVREANAWLAEAIDAHIVSQAMTQGMSLDGQRAAKSIDVIVADCAEILDMPKPRIMLRRDFEARAYCGYVGKQGVIVFTSELLNLYEGRPDELRFMIGRELGHLKSQHSRERAAAIALITGLSKISERAPDGVQTALVSFSLGRFLSWLRAAEISADQAGLLCCQDFDVAMQAMLRPRHGLKASSPWLDPASPDFDPKRVLAEMERWEDMTVIRLLRKVQTIDRTMPFLWERAASLKFWSNSQQYQNVLARRSSGERLKGRVKITAITISDIANGTDSNSLHLTIESLNGHPLFKTQQKDTTKDVQWTGEQVPIVMEQGEPVFMQVWKNGYLWDQVLGGISFYPDLTQSESSETAAVDWQWSARSEVTRRAVATISYQVLPPDETDN